MNEIAFTTDTGSHLYGLAHEGSDRDSMIVYLDGRRARQRVSEGDDITRVGIYDLIEKAQSGAHQYVEVVMSRKKIWHDDSWKSYIENLQIPAAQIAEKYERTIKNLCFQDSMKMRRHAVRLWCNLYDLRTLGAGRFNPTLSKGDKDFTTWLAERYEGTDLKEILFNQKKT